MIGGERPLSQRIREVVDEGSDGLFTNVRDGSVKFKLEISQGRTIRLALSRW